MPISIYREDGLASSTAIKGPCRVATTANVTLAGEQTIDGVACVTGDRVLVKDQTAPTENGIYIVDTGAWRRSADFEGNRDVRKGTQVYVHSGSQFGWYRVESADPIVIDTSSITLQFTERGDPVLPQANASASGAGYIDFFEDTDNGTSRIRLQGQSSLGADRLLLAPDADDTLVGLAAAQTLTNKTLTQPTLTLKQGTAPTPTAEGDAQWDTDDNVLVVGNGTDQSKFYPTKNVPVFGCGQFQLVSSTSVKLAPYRGNLVSFPSGQIAAIPSAGVSSTITSTTLCYINGAVGAALSATTLYYAYLWNQGSVASPNWVIDWSTTSHATDSNTGIEIKSGDATRVLVGMIRTAAGPTVLDAAANRLVASWFNRRPVSLRNAFTADRSTGSTGYVEVNSEIRCNFLSWGDAVTMAYAGKVSAAAGTISVFTGPSVDGAGTGFPATASGATTTTGQNMAVSGVAAVTEGFHYITVMGAVSSSTGIWESASQMGSLTGSVSI